MISPQNHRQLLSGNNIRLIISKMLYWIIISFVVFYLAILIYVYFSQDSLFFYPSKEHQISPDELNIEYQDLYLKHDNGEKINAWYFEPPITNENQIERTIIFCHGNAGNISGRLETVQFLLQFDLNILLFDYRGYGKSDGVPSEEKMYQDAKLCYEFLIHEKKMSPTEIIIFGRSLGGAVAVDLAAQVKCGGLVVESSFNSSLDIAKKSFPYLPVGLLMKYKFDSSIKIKKINCPVLVGHSPEDEIIPFQLGVNLYEAAISPKEFYELSCGHNDREYYSDEIYREKLNKILNQPTDRN